MRLLPLLLLFACTKPVTTEVPYVDTSVEVKRVKPLRVIERGSGVVSYATPPVRVSVKNPGVATVVRFDGERRFHVFGETQGETVLIADLGDVRHQLPIEVVKPEVDIDLELTVGQQMSMPVDGEVARVVVGDPAVVGYRVIGAGGSVQIEGLKAGASHVVVSTGEEASPTFAWVVVE